MSMFAPVLQVVNAFSLQTDVEMKAKVITRLCNMTDLHQLLSRSLTGNFTQTLPAAITVTQ